MAPLELCTIVDARYVTRCLVLHRSLLRHSDDFRLSVWTVDADARAALEAVALPHLEVRPLEHLYEHDPDYAAVAPSRPLNERCWTAKSVACQFRFDDAPGARVIAWIDADTMFWGPPEPVFDAIGDGAVLLLPHWPPDAWATAPADWALGGRYNGGLVAFAPDDRGRAVLDWWRDRCIEGVPTVGADGHLFADQRYLDEIPERFEGVGVIDDVGAILAPWNGGTFAVTERDGAVHVEGRPLRFYHYHSLRIVEHSRAVRASARRSPKADVLANGPEPLAWAVWQHYSLTRAEQELIWRPYVRELVEQRAAVPATVADRSPPLRLGTAGAAKEIARHWVSPSLVLRADRVRRRAKALSSRG